MDYSFKQKGKSDGTGRDHCFGEENSRRPM